MIIAGFVDDFQIVLSRPSYDFLLRSVFSVVSFTENSTNTRSGFFESRSFATLCTPIYEPVAPIPALT